MSLSVGAVKHIRSGAPVASVMALAADEEDKTLIQSFCSAELQSAPLPTNNALRSSLTHGDLYAFASSAPPAASRGEEGLSEQIVSAYLHVLCEELRRQHGRDIAVSLGTRFYAEVVDALEMAAVEEGEGVRFVAYDGISLPRLDAIPDVMCDWRHLLRPYSPTAARFVLLPIPIVGDRSKWVLAVWDRQEHSWTMYDGLCDRKGFVPLTRVYHMFAECSRIHAAGREPELGAGGSAVTELLLVRPALRTARHRPDIDDTVNTATATTANNDNNTDAAAVKTLSGAHERVCINPSDLESFGSQDESDEESDEEDDDDDDIPSYVRDLKRHDEAAQLESSGVTTPPAVRRNVGFTKNEFMAQRGRALGRREEQPPQKVSEGDCCVFLCMVARCVTAGGVGGGGAVLFTDEALRTMRLAMTLELWSGRLLFLKPTS